MNPREKRLLIALVLVVGIGGIGLGAYAWFVKPLLAYNKAIQTASDDRDMELLKWNTFEFEKKKLEWARLKSLPLNPGDASSEYENYLERMIAQTSLKVLGIAPSQAVKVKPTGTVPNVKEVGHFLMSFTLSARGELADVVKFMELLQATPYEHRIKAMNLDRADMSTAKNASKTLTVTILSMRRPRSTTTRRSSAPASTTSSDRISLI